MTDEAVILACLTWQACKYASSVTGNFVSSLMPGASEMQWRDRQHSLHSRSVGWKVVENNHCSKSDRLPATCHIIVPLLLLLLGVIAHRLAYDQTLP